MKTLWKSFKITIAFCIFFSLFYILVLWIFAQFAGPNKGNAEVATLNGKVVGAANVGQMFTQDIYFWGRPSAGDYTADASGGSNKGPTNDEYLAEVEARIDTFLVHHPYLSRKDVPAEMVTASGSGLDRNHWRLPFQQAHPCGSDKDDVPEKYRYGLPLLPGIHRS